jgi:hypothetical protein
VTLLLEYATFQEGSQRLSDVMLSFIDPEELAKQEIPAPSKPIKLKG